MSFSYLNGGNKLILLFVGIIILFIINYFLNFDAFLGLKKNSNINSFLPKNTPYPTQIIVSPTLTPTTLLSPAPTAIKSIPRMRNRGFEDK